MRKILVEILVIVIVVVCCAGLWAVPVINPGVFNHSTIDPDSSAFQYSIYHEENGAPVFDGTHTFAPGLTRKQMTGVLVMATLKDRFANVSQSAVSETEQVPPPYNAVYYNGYSYGADNLPGSQ